MANVCSSSWEAAMRLQDMPLEQLESEITELAAHINAATCRWLLLIGEHDRREGWAEWGCKSCAHWLSVQCGLGLRAGSAAGAGGQGACRAAGDPGGVRPRRTQLLAGSRPHARGHP